MGAKSLLLNKSTPVWCLDTASVGSLWEFAPLSERRQVAQGKELISSTSLWSFWFSTQPSLD